MNYKVAVLLLLSSFFNLYGTHWSRLLNSEETSIWEDSMELEQMPSITIDVEMSDSSDMIQMPDSEIIKKKLTRAGLKNFANSSQLPYLLGDESIDINALTATLASTFIHNQAHLKFDDSSRRKNKSSEEVKRMVIQSLTNDHQIAYDRMCTIFLQQSASENLV